MLDFDTGSWPAAVAELEEETGELPALHGENLADELAAYYAPVPCEDHFVSDLENHARRKEIQRARRKRWAKRARAEWWVPHPEPTYPEDRRLGGD